MAVTGFRRSVVALTVLIATAVVAILVVVSHVLLSRVTDADAHDLARTRAEAVAANVSVKGGRVVLTENGSEALDEVAWVYADGRLVDGDVPPSVVGRVEELADSGRSQTATVGDYLLFARPVPTGGHNVMVIVRVDLTPYETSEQRSLTLSLILGGLTILLAGGVAHLVVHRALRVVHEMAALADDWGHHEPGRRFNLGVPVTSSGNWGRPWIVSWSGLTTRWRTSAGSPTRSPTSCGHRSRSCEARRSWRSCPASRWCPRWC